MSITKISDIRTNTNKEAVKNTYEMKSDNVIVRVNFNDNGKTLEESLVTCYKQAV